MAEVKDGAQTLFTRDQAEELVDDMNADRDDPWSYDWFKATKRGGEWYTVEIFDEVGEWTGTL